MIKDREIRNGFYCGCFLFILNTVVFFSGTLLLVITAIFLPGFLFGILLVSQTKMEVPLARSVLYIGASGLLYIFSSWLVTGSGMQIAPLSFLLAATTGALVLLSIHKLLLDRSVKWNVGIGYALFTGFVASILPVASILSDERFESSSIELIGPFSVFATWQPLFIWSLKRAGKQKRSA